MYNILGRLPRNGASFLCKLTRNGHLLLVHSLVVAVFVKRKLHVKLDGRFGFGEGILALIKERLLAPVALRSEMELFSPKAVRLTVRVRK